MAKSKSANLDAISRKHVVAALEELESGTEHPYGPAMKYEVLYQQSGHPPKAVVGLAFRHATGRVLPVSSVTSEEKALTLLNRLGFESRLIEGTGEDWSAEECSLLVADYFEMLQAELLGRPFNKARHNEQLRGHVRRSRGSIERKHMNVSAVMVELALPYIKGYKPNVNRQQRLVDAVESYLYRHSDFFDRPEVASRIESVETTRPIIRSAEECFEDPPETNLPPRPSQPWKSRKGRKIDYAIRDAMNRELGRVGEVFAVDLERRRLAEKGRSDLAQKVRHVAAEDGDGAGFDVLSFNHVNESERWLEVKTTTLGKFHPFLVTANELACSRAEPLRFELFRVFEYGPRPRVFRLLGPLHERCRLEPTVYRAGPPYTDWER